MSSTDHITSLNLDDDDDDDDDGGGGGDVDDGGGGGGGGGSGGNVINRNSMGWMKSMQTKQYVYNLASRDDSGHQHTGAASTWQIVGGCTKRLELSQDTIQLEAFVINNQD